MKTSVKTVFAVVVLLLAAAMLSAPSSGSKTPQTTHPRGFCLTDGTIVISMYVRGRISAQHLRDVGDVADAPFRDCSAASHASAYHAPERMAAKATPVLRATALFRGVRRW